MAETTLIYAKGTDKRPSVWLCWTISLLGLQTLEGIATRPDTAATWVKAVKYWRDEYHLRYKDIVRVWAEPVWTDHLICMPMVNEKEMRQIADAWERSQ